MSSGPNALARALHLRAGEGRTLLVLGGYLLLVTATTTILSATKNGLFLSAYPGRYIPHVVIGAAFVTAVVSVVFSGVIAGTARRSLALRLTTVLVAVVLASRWAFGWDPRMALLVYLVMSSVQVLALTHAWDFTGDLLTGRQAKRLAPLLGIGASIGALIGGGAVPAAALTLGTENLLVIGGILLGAALPLLWLLPEPAAPVDESATVGKGAVRSFVTGAGRGFRSIGSEPLLRLMAVGVVCISLTGTLIELQFKLALQATLDKDQITAVMGIMSGVVGVGTLLAQLVASRWLFPKLGVSFAAALHGGLMAFAAGGAAVFGGIWILAALQALDDILQFSVQKPVEQVSLLPFAGAVKSSAMATLGGVMRPLSKAAAGGLAILLVSKGHVVPILTAASATVAFVVLLRHRRLYMDALVKALGRHTVDFTSRTDVPLVVDRAALAVIDKGLADQDPTVVVFSVSLTEQLPPEDAIPRAVAQFRHPVPEVRAEAARVLGRLDLAPEEVPAAPVLEALAREQSRFVQASLLATLGEWQVATQADAGAYLSAPDPRVRRAALVSLGKSGWEGLSGELERLLGGEATSDDRVVASGAVGDLGAVDFLNQVAGAVEDAAARPVALEALSALGAPAVPVLAGLLQRRDLPLPLRRSVITAVAAVEHQAGRDALIALADEPALGPAALTSLQRLRRDGRLDPVDPARLRSGLQAEIRKGLRYALVATLLKERGELSKDHRFIAGELEGLAERASYRVMRILTLTHDPERVEAVRMALGSPEVATRSNALELLEGTLSPQEGRLVVPFAEAMADGFPLDRVAALVGAPEEVRATPLEALTDDTDWWPRSLALHGLGRDAEITFPGRDPDSEEDVNMIPLIERVMILKGSQLFRYFPGSDLAGIASLADEVHLQDGESVFEQGDVGDAFYMVVRGNIRIMRGSHELAVLGPREGFGEMAILDQETRSATATAAEPTTLLRIDRDSFDRLIEQNPSVARGIYRMLTQRLRNTLAQVAAG